MNVTSKSFRHFAADCLIWAAQTPDANHRQTIVTAARKWATTADAIDRFVDTGHGTALPDLKSKLN